MASNGLPEGWSYEPEDRSVGIFGDAFVHEDCPREDVQEATQDWSHNSLLLTCACGATVTLEAPDPEPEWPEDDR